jgi:hypothetical protein
VVGSDMVTIRDAMQMEQGDMAERECMIVFGWSVY